MFTPMHTLLRPGSLGDVRLETFEVTPEEAGFTRLRAAVTMRRDEVIDAGTYARLYVGKTLMMTDTRNEQRTNTEVVRRAQGDVFIAGLGLGMILVPILAKEAVKSVTVIEKYQHVVTLVAPQLQAIPGGEKLTVVHGDVFTWQPPKGQKWDVLYFDIWPDICVDNLPEMASLHQKYKSRKKPGAWMHSWRRDYLLAKREQEREADYGFRCGRFGT